MATTQRGLPYPVGTDFVVDGDNAIRALAEGIERMPIPYVPATDTINTGSGGSKLFRYWWDGADMVVEFEVIWGSGAAVGSGGVTFQLPTGWVFDDFYPAYAILGVGAANNDGAGTAVSPVNLARMGLSPSTLMVLGIDTSGPAAISRDVGLTFPFAFAVNGFFYGRAQFQVMNAA